MASIPLTQTIIRYSDVNARKPHKFDVRPSKLVCRTIANDLGLLTLAKLCLNGTLSSIGKDNWRLKAHLGATIEQSCVLSLEPVQARIDSLVERNYLPLKTYDEPSDGLDGVVEMKLDETLEPLETELDLMHVMIEALLIELPTYPKVTGASFGKRIIVAPGIIPLSDEDAKPFANLSLLMDKSAKET